MPSEGKACTFSFAHFQLILAELEAFDMPLSCARFDSEPPGTSCNRKAEASTRTDWLTIIVISEEPLENFSTFIFLILRL